LARLGVLNRMDVRIKPGEDQSRVIAAMRASLPAGAQVASVEAESQRGGALSRAYRINLDMLALIALITGAFLVYATQFIAHPRRRAQFALLRSLGMTRRELASLLLMEGSFIGAVGAACGVALGIALAAFGVRYFGGELGAGYFRTLEARLALEPA